MHCRIRDMHVKYRLNRDKHVNYHSYTLKTIVLNLNPLELILALSKCSVGDSTISAILNLYL